MNDQKHHIIHLPHTHIPTHYARDSDVLSISIPLFYSETGYSSHFDDITHFNIDKFRNILVKSAVWSAVSLLTNTDFGEKGVPIYFHVEDKVYDLCFDEMQKYGVPDEWLRKVSFGHRTWQPEHINPNEGSPCLSKKYASLLDDEIQTAHKMIFDADAFVYRREGDPLLQWYDVVKEHFQENIIVQFYTDNAIGDAKHVAWLNTGVATVPPSEEADMTELEASERRCYERLGLTTKFGRKRAGTQIMSFPRDHKFVDFIKENINLCYQDEAILTMFLQSEGNEDVSVMEAHQAGIPYLGFLTEDDFHNYSDKSRVIHPCGFRNTFRRWFVTFKRGIDGRNREKPIKLFPYPKKRIFIFPVMHNLVSPEFSPCAFAQKGRKLPIMCKMTDNEVIFFGNELDKDVVDCDEFVSVSNEEMLTETYGDFRDQSNFYTFHSQDYNSRVAREHIIHNYRKRAADGDILCYTFGHQQHELYERLFEEFPNALHIESGIGYYRPYMYYKVFETASHRQYSYGEAGQRYWEWERIPEEQRPDRDFRNTFHYGMTQWQDGVICNSWGREEFTPNFEKGGDYILFIGRIVTGKGVEIAMRVADAVGKKLIVAGQGDFEKELGFEPWDCVELVGMVGPERRRELMFHAECIIAPTTYLDVLCGVCCEAGLAARPIIGPGFGGPNEVIEHGITGYKCNSFCQYVRAVDNIDKIDPVDCYNNAIAKFTNEAIAPKYDEYFDRITRFAENGCDTRWIFDLSRGIDW